MVNDIPKNFDNTSYYFPKVKSNQNEFGLLLTLSVIIPCLNEINHIDYLIKSIILQSHLPNDIIFVDGGSTDGTIKRINHWQKKYSIIHLIRTSPPSPARQRNAGAKISRGNILLFLDSDTFFFDDQNLFKRILVRYCNPKVFGVCGITKQYDGKVITQITYFLYHFIRWILSLLPYPIKRYLTSSSFLSIRKDVFYILGGFDSSKMIGEDGIFGACCRQFSQETGLKTILDLNLRIWHIPRRFTHGWFESIHYYLYILPFVFGFLEKPFANITFKSEQIFKNRS